MHEPRTPETGVRATGWGVRQVDLRKDIVPPEGQGCEGAAGRPSPDAVREAFTGLRYHEPRVLVKRTRCQGARPPRKGARCSGRACPGLFKLPTIRRPVTCGCAACYAERLGLSGAQASWTTSSGRLEGSAFQPAGRRIRRCRIARRGRAFPRRGAAEPLSRQASAANLDSRRACPTRAPAARTKGTASRRPTPL